MDTLYDTNYTRYIFFPKEIATIIKSNSYLINNLYAYVLVRFSYITSLISYITSLTTIQVKLYLYLLEI